MDRTFERVNLWRNVTDSPTPADVRELLSRACAAFNARDLDAALSAMHPDVEWANGMEGGYVRGRDGVRAYWKRQWGLIDPFVDPLAFRTEPDGRILVDVRQRVFDKDGARLSDGPVQHVYTLRDGLVRRMEIRESTDTSAGQQEPPSEDRSPSGG